MPAPSILVLLACLGSADEPRAVATRTLGFLPPELPEASGLARSRTRAGHVWLINDGDHPPVLYRLDPATSTLRSWPVVGLDNRDWEALSSFRHQGRDWLAIGDLGDNEARHDHLRVGLLHEPTEDLAVARIVKTIRFRIPGGPRDVESLAVDGETGEILIMTKRTEPPLLLGLDLPARARDAVADARLIGPLPGILRPEPWQVAADPEMGRWLAQPTGAALHDGRLAVLTYDRVYLYRRPAARWQDGPLAGPEAVLGFSRLPQQEAITFLSPGTLLITTENRPAPLLAVDLPDD